MADPLDPIVNDDSDVISRVLSVSPVGVTDSNLDHVIANLRQARALFIKADLNKGEPKDVPPSETEASDQASE